MPLKITILALLLLGILNPVLGNRVDEAVCILVFVIGALVAFFLKSFAKIALIFLILVYLANSWFISGDLRFFLTHDIPYNNDPGVLLATYKSVENGRDYYESYKQAQLGRFSQSIIPGDIWGWRLPTVFYIWKIMPGQALSIYVLYLILAATVLYVAFLINRMFLPENLALLSPYLIFPYLHFATRDQMLLETEWWAVSIFIFAIYALLKRQLFFSTVFFSLTLLIREIYILPVGLMLIGALFRQRKLIPVFTVPLISYSALFIYHILRVNEFTDAWGTILAARTVDNGFLFLQQTLAFASWEYLANLYRPFYFLTLAAVMGCLYIFKFQKRQEALFLLLAFLPFPIAFLKFGTTPFNEYWGIIYVPIAIMLSPLLLTVFSQSSRKLKHFL